MATNASRESRRRKIIDRGSDRLALIYGRVPNPHPDSGNDHDVHSTGSFDLSHSLASASVSSVAEEMDLSFGLPKHKSFDVSRQASDYSGRDPAFSASSGSSPSQPPSANQTSPISTSRTVQGSERKKRQLEIFTPAQISSAISSTENTRLLCSGAAAILVVLSNLGFPLLGSRFINSIVSFRPLFLLLLTNMTVVAAKVLGNHGGSERADRGDTNNASVDEYAWADQLGKTLEVGMAMQKAFDAIIMDCSLYAVIIICGLCFT